MFQKKTWLPRPASLAPRPGEDAADVQARVQAYVAANPGAVTPLNADALNDLETRVDTKLATVDEDILGARGVSVPSIEILAHSWGAAAGVTEAKYDWPARLVGLLGGATLRNASQSGGAAAGPAVYGGLGKILQDADFAPDLDAGPYFSHGGLKIAMLGTNDETIFGTSTEARALIKSALRGVYSFLRAARSYVPGTADYTTGGPFGLATAALTAANLGSVYGYSFTNGDWIDLPLDAAYNGEAFCFGCPIMDGYAITGRWDFTLDPAGASTPLGSLDLAPLDGAQKAHIVDAGLGSVGDGSCVTFYVPAGTIPPGAHTIRATSAALAGDGSNFATFGGAWLEGGAPLVLPLLPPRPGNAAATTSFAATNTMVQEAAAEMDGVIFADLSEAMAPNYGAAGELDDERFWFDSNHPNNLGCARIAGAVLDAVRRNVTLEQLGEMA